MENNKNIKIIGGYGKVEILSDNYINKKQYIYRSKTLNYATISEAIFLKNIELNKYIKHIPKIYKIHMNNRRNVLNFEMPYYGEDLNTWTLRASYEDRIKHLKDILISVVTACIELEHIGIQHTDIKPGNILIQYVGGIFRVTLIDLNLCSVKTTEMIEYGNLWSESIGTWIYVAPEICKTGIPQNTSPCWSIAMILIFIIHKHPLYDHIKNNKINYEDNDSWNRLLDMMKGIYHDNLPIFEKTKQYIPNEDYELYHKIYTECTKWDPKERMNIYELYELLTGDKYWSFTTNKKYIIKTIDKEKRDKDLELIKNICYKSNTRFILSRSIGLYDKINMYINDDKKSIIAISICISLLIHGYYITSNDTIIELLENECNIDNWKKFYSDILEILEKVNWNIYDIPADVCLYEMFTYNDIIDINQLYDEIYKAHCMIYQEYSMKEIAEYAYKEMYVKI